ncbi:MAG: NUDIX hydrolase YfcD [Desulfobulbaceae bacterium]|jgi:isopentenyldiphosphate isomerase|nr:NUDIX hydrolase YfcD [Desulfobulbaceae bacterium]
MERPETPQEIVALIDRDNHIIGASGRARMRAECLGHRAAAIFVRNGEGGYFVQRRAATKDIYPGCLDVAAGGVVLAGERYDQAAARELAEELGISGQPLAALFDHYYEAADNRVWSRVYLCQHDGPFVLQASEVAGGSFMSARQIAASTDTFTPDSLTMLSRVEQLARRHRASTIFLHGLDSSGLGAKGEYFQRHFDHVFCPDFSGDLANRLQLLREIVGQREGLTLVGSSYGGLMAVCAAMRRPRLARRLILMAPALNMGGFQPPAQKITTPTLLVIGHGDTVTPPEQVLPLAQATFANLKVHQVDDDHHLTDAFLAMNWRQLLEE